MRGSTPSQPPHAAHKHKLRVGLDRSGLNSGSKDPGSTELDTRIFALLIPAMLAVFLDPAMAVVDAGVPVQRCILPLPNASASAGLPQQLMYAQ